MVDSTHPIQLEGTFIRIINWEKYNPRKDVLNSTWFRLNHDLFDRSDVVDFGHQDFLLWIYLLCEASKASKPTMHINYLHIRKTLSITQKKAEMTLKKLHRNQMIAMDITDTLRARDGNVTDAGLRTYERDVRDERTNAHFSNARHNFDFEKIYEKYPRKIGKSPGMKKAKKEVFTQEGYDELLSAVEKFAAHHQEQKTEAEFIPYFSTFMNQWRDWLDSKTGTATSSANSAINWDHVYEGQS